jgi:hypothetical protein
MWVADTLGERVAECHVPGEHDHGLNLADATAICSPAARQIGKWTPIVKSLFVFP